MNRSILNSVVVAAILGVSLVASNCEAAEPTDVRIGTFDGNWCGSRAKFTITKQIGTKKVFEGTVEIISTGQVDRINIQQKINKTLHMTRYLSGKHTGQTQVMLTHPPETKSVGNSLVVNFPAKSTFGYGARLAGFLRLPISE